VSLWGEGREIGHEGSVRGWQSKDFVSTVHPSSA
jgi:hypothetical protein